MKKAFLVALIALLAIGGTVFAGGAQETKGGAQETKKGGLDIGIAMPETHVARWVTDGKKLQENAEALGYKAEWISADGDQTKQNKQIQDFITKGVKLIIVASINTGINAVLPDVAREGIEIISYDRLLMDSGDFNYYTTFNLKKVGFLQATAIVQALNLDKATSPKYITLFAGSPTDNNAYFFYDGAMEVLNPYIKSGKLKVVGPYPVTSADKENFQRISTEGWRAEYAKKRMENLLTNDAKDVVLDAVLAPNDPVGRAIIEACMNDAKYDTIAKLPIVTGQDGELATVQYILEGKQYMTVFKDSRDLAAATIKLADAILKKQTPNIPGTVKTTFNTNVKDVTTYLLDPVLVTKDNVKKVIIDSGYYTKDELKTIGQ
ncbi:MAG TPA: sugar ABC transporter substrate-binding protein [Spirochaetia bacterium]|nr:sugar ABC transporter substrate-binding protein [Spirochaetia bacterium]